MDHIKIILTIFGIILGVGAIIALVSYLRILWPPVREEDVKDAVEKHLQDKYQQEFVIEDVSYQAEITEYEIKVYPENNEKQDFTITVTEEQIENLEKEITDGYLYIYWDHQLEEEFKRMAEDIFEGQVDKVTADVSPGGYTPENEALPRYKNIRMKMPDQFMHEFVLYLNLDISEVNKRDVEEKVFDLIEEIRAKKMKKPKLWVFFSNDYQYHLERGEVDTIQVAGDLEAFLQFNEDPLIY